MSNANRLSSKVLIFVFSLALAAAAGIPALGQDSAQTPSQGGGYVDDWSFHRLMYSNPGTESDALHKGTHDRWLKITNDPRYQMQLKKRSMGTRPVTSDPSLVTEPGGFVSLPRRPGLPSGFHPAGSPIERDWSQPLGGVPNSLTSTLAATNSSTTVGPTSTITVGTQTFTTGAPGTASLIATIATPLTNGTNISGSSSLVIDGVTFNASPPTPEQGTITFNGAPCTSSNLFCLFTASSVTLGSITYTFVSSAGSTNPSSGCNVVSATGSTGATYLYDAIFGLGTPGSGTYRCRTGSTPNPNFNSSTSTNSGGTITLYAATPGSTGFGTWTSTGTTNFNPFSTTAGLNGTTSTTSTNPETFAYWSGNAPVSSSTLATTIATLVGATNTTTSAVLTAAANSPANDDITFTAKTPGTGGNAYSVTPGSFSAFTGGSLTGGTNGPGDTATTFNYWGGQGTTSTYDTGSQLATDLHTALAANTTVKTTDAITATAGTNEITFATTKAGPFPISVQNFSAFSGMGTIGYPAIAAALQPNAFPAKYGASISTANCGSDFVVYPTGQAGATSAATIVAFNQLYSSCTGSPSVYWAYNTGAGDSVSTSPIISLDGSQIAFIQSSGTSASLVVLKWKQSTTASITAPVTLTSTSSYPGCTAPCMTVVPFANGHNDTYSAPFYDYTAENDKLFVGDNSGYLHEFTGVFFGTPAEAGSGWPLSLGSAAIASPVYDAGDGVVVVGDMAGSLHFVTASNATVQGTAPGVGDAIVDAPLVDGVFGTAFAFVNKGGSYSETNYNAIYQYPMSWNINAVKDGQGHPGVVALWTTNVVAPNGLTGHYLYSGTFDNVYFSTNSGSLYVVGNTGATTPTGTGYPYGATLYRVGVSNGALTGAVAAVVNDLTADATDAYPWPSPLSEFCNGTCAVSGGITTGGTDYVFFSVNQGNNANYSGCTAGAGNGCIFSFNVNNPAAVTVAGEQNYTNVGTDGCWPTSGIVVDNDATTAGASQIYFISLDGATAGGASGATSSACTTGTATTIDGIQASQSAP